MVSVKRLMGERRGKEVALLLIALLGAAGCKSEPPSDKTGKPITLGRIRLRTFPAGARVWIDGELKVESTPATLILQHGEYHLRIQAEGAEAMERTLEVEAGDVRELDINIPKPPEATITVLSDVEGAKVRINGYTRGYTPVLRARTKPGAVDITVLDPLGRAKSIPAELAIGEQKIVEVVFEEDGEGQEDNPAEGPTPKAFLTLGLKPDGEVFDEEGRSLGKTPVVDLPMDGGTHNLTLRSLDGQYEKRVEIQLKAPKTSIYRFRFQDEDRKRGWRPRKK